MRILIGILAAALLAAAAPGMATTVEVRACGAQDADGDFNHNPPADNWSNVALGADSEARRLVFQFPNTLGTVGGVAGFASDAADGDADGDGWLFEGGAFIHAGLYVDGQEQAGAGSDSFEGADPIPSFGPAQTCPVGTQ